MMRKGLALQVLLLALFSLSPCPAATLVVDLNGTGGYTDIQSAIDAAANGDTVLVKPGEYVIDEPINFNRLHDPDDPASPPVKNITVRSEGGAEVTTIRMSDTPKDPDRASVVIFENGEALDSAIEGFRLTGGSGTGDPHSGGGLYCAGGSSPTVTNCTISGNTVWWGGGLYCDDNASPSPSPTLTNCMISGNSADVGGGVYCWGVSPTLTNCTISGNSAVHDGGVCCENNSSPTLTNCMITGNSSYSCGGMYCRGGSPTLTNCRISGNLGVGVDCLESSPTIANCWISGNWGSGIRCYGSSPSLVNCMIAGNSAIHLITMDRCVRSGAGGGVRCMGNSSPTLTNCAIIENCATVDGGVYCENSFPILLDCIVWGNTPESVCGSLSNCITGQSPLFVQPGEWLDCLPSEDVDCFAYEWSGCGPAIAWHRWIPGDYHLLPTSPCIDAGTSEGAPTTDIEGNTRPCWRGVDIGAYEYCGADPPHPIQQFKRGDPNSDSQTNISDPVFNLNYQFALGPTPTCLKTADVNDDGLVNLADPIFQLNYLFVSGPTPPPPISECGIDPTADTLSCEEYAPCR
ncbi:MAG: right-handed parallel beta-helix repeat-containing protein [Armatimonadetes bacterium]|nr:right-handed parallel beta-helix repeat-containing protein [Armatimonadota bacterium]